MPIDTTNSNDALAPALGRALSAIALRRTEKLATKQKPVFVNKEVLDNVQACTKSGACVL